MSSFNDFCADAKRFAGKAAKKTGELAHCASLHLKLEGVKNKLCAKYEKLGRLTYKQLKSGESMAEKISEVISDIDSLRLDETDLKNQIDALKQEESDE
ncbi:MAG: hypothetical protein IKB02_02820 [Clostridia bacterium]|nr:hypothetical protein [Clostridia bacterium]